MKLMQGINNKTSREVAAAGSAMRKAYMSLADAFDAGGPSALALLDQAVIGRAELDVRSKVALSALRTAMESVSLVFAHISHAAKSAIEGKQEERDDALEVRFVFFDINK